MAPDARRGAVPRAQGGRATRGVGHHLAESALRLTPSMSQADLDPLWAREDTHSAPDIYRFAARRIGCGALGHAVAVNSASDAAAR